MYSLNNYEPSSKHRCLCGSGKRFKRCCKGEYSSKAQKDTYKEFNKGNYKEALEHCRHHITWYLLCHKAHTVPFLSSGKPEAFELLKVDILAMADLVDLLHLCYFRTGISGSFPETLTFFDNAISDMRWSNVIKYQRALWYLVDKNDRGQAYREISQIDIDSCDNPEILTLYLDVNPKEVSFTDKQALLDRIIQNTTKESYILQYTTLQGIAFCLIGETDKGSDIIRSAINRYQEIAEGSRSGYGDYRLAQALEMLGEFENEKDTVQKAIEIYQKELHGKNYSSSGEAMLCKSIGDCYLFVKDFAEAIFYYETSLAKEGNDLTKVFLSRAFINSHKINKGKNLLTAIDDKKFNEANKYDLAISWALLAFCLFH